MTTLRNTEPAAPVSPRGARRAPRHRGWQVATVAERRVESDSAVTLELDLPDWGDAVAGQHVDVRLTAEDGYQASRSYSLSSGAGESPSITVQRVDDGEVSPYLVDVVEVGDKLEVLGPLGGYFVWHGGGDPVLLIGGGSGIVPLRSMWRSRSEGSRVRLLASVQDPSREIFGEEMGGLDLPVTVHYTRTAATDLPERPWDVVAGRIDAAAVAAALEVADGTDVFICGPTAFVDTAADAARAAGIPATRIRTERFG